MDSRLDGILNIVRLDTCTTITEVLSVVEQDITMSIKTTHHTAFFMKCTVLDFGLLQHLMTEVMNKLTFKTQEPYLLSGPGVGHVLSLHQHVEVHALQVHALQVQVIQVVHRVHALARHHVPVGFHQAVQVAVILQVHAHAVPHLVHVHLHVQAGYPPQVQAVVLLILQVSMRYRYTTVSPPPMMVFIVQMSSHT